jgi:hypothetical protein
MTLKQSILTVGGIGIVTSLLGLIEGIIMGSLHPAYYRAYSYSTKDFTDEELRSVAIGLGVENGLLLGLGIGFLIVIIMVFRELKLARLSKDP